MDKELLDATVAQLRHGDTVRGKKVFAEGRWINFSGPAMWHNSQFKVGETPLTRRALGKTVSALALSELEITGRTNWEVGDLARIERGSNELVIVGLNPLAWSSPTQGYTIATGGGLVPRIALPAKPKPGDTVRDRNDTLMTVVDLGLKKALVEHTNRERRWVELETLTVVEDEVMV